MDESSLVSVVKGDTVFQEGERERERERERGKYREEEKKE